MNFTPPSPRTITFNPGLGWSKFYNYKVTIVTESAGNITKTVATKLIHTSVTAIADGIITMMIESFDYTHKDRSLSQGVKDLISRLERLTQDIKATLNDKSNILFIANHKDIINAIEQTTAYIQVRYKGEGLKKVNDFYRRVLRKEQSLIRYISDYRRLGLLLNIPYGWVGASFLERRTVRFDYFMDNTILDIVESFKLDVHEDYIKLQGRGEVKNNVHFPLFIAEMKNNRLLYSANSVPVLNAYNLDIHLHPDDYTAACTTLFADFSFGDNYRRQITGQLTQVNAEDIL